ncbi:TetR/AcrR family transcriptional regulator [Streptomyces albireticuli]|uniref:TetR family transcriptional regulator n=1 Tax=Streptomyces albireticuli TaxID=1940 RepID=A0A2A2D3J6_9ACTN|nr:TetR/AcrR family transcriptional regulator [Streptomyces albireticuli]MCD9141634.1 TetR family transcriptional regulator [Streptomyces albireticuli]MCD9164115.1 TetR family transcriptional regulator [Streptomyces albireticuli]MCD9189808.1 TetR family transcriptional regulator [Streptomyces albireticuli]PAU46104.1 TetR family transcriptional regulator [Streptomyces albireticuli]
MTVDTKERLIGAAETVLRTQGYAKSSARTIAKEAGVNSALVFYHFGGVDPLLFAALDRSSAERMAVLADAVAGCRTLEDLTEAATRIYRHDIEAGHLTLFAELVAAAVAKPDLREQIRVRAEPWIAFVEETLERVIGGTPLARLTPPRDLANAAITFYLGVNLFTVLDADRSRTDSVFAMARRLAPRARLLTRRLPARLVIKRRAHG